MMDYDVAAEFITDADYSSRVFQWMVGRRWLGMLMIGKMDDICLWWWRVDKVDFWDMSERNDHLDRQR